MHILLVHCILYTVYCIQVYTTPTFLLLLLFPTGIHGAAVPIASQSVSQPLKKQETQAGKTIRSKRTSPQTDGALDTGMHINADQPKPLPRIGHDQRKFTPCAPAIFSLHLESPDPFFSHSRSQQLTIQQKKKSLFKPQSSAHLPKTPHPEIKLSTVSEAGTPFVCDN